jgi:HEAT repeat protein
LVAGAYRSELDPDRRWAAIHCLWQYRDHAALPALSAALRDADERVWKEALDGLVTLGGPSAARALQEASLFLAQNARGARIQRAWIDEAIQQIRESADPD